MFGRSTVANMKLEAPVATAVMEGWMIFAAPYGALAVSVFKWHVKPMTRRCILTTVALGPACRQMLPRLFRTMTTLEDGIALNYLG